VAVGQWRNKAIAPYALSKMGLSCATERRAKPQGVAGATWRAELFPPATETAHPRPWPRHAVDDSALTAARGEIGQTCKRNRASIELLRALGSVARHRRDLRLHGFGLKRTTLPYPHGACGAVPGRRLGSVHEGEGEDGVQLRDGFAGREKASRPPVAENVTWKRPLLSERSL
jgi:hypothetical protein